VASKRGQCLPKLRRMCILPQYRTPPKNTTAEDIEARILLFALRTKHLSEIQVERFYNEFYTTSTLLGVDPTRGQEAFATTRLSLIDCQLEPQFLQQFLLKFNSLTHFKYRQKDFVKTNEFRVLVPAMIKKGLSNSKHCLDELILENTDTTSNSEHIRHYPQADQPLGSMTDFKKLKVLDVEAVMLLGM
jgi:hypothetical protein